MLNEQQLTQFMEFLPQGILIFDSETHEVVFTNTEMKKILSTSREDIYKFDRDTFHNRFVLNEDRKVLLDRLGGETNVHKRHDRKSVELEYRIKDARGNIKYVRQVSFEGKSPNLLFFIITDITNEKKNEEILKQSEEEYRTIVETQNDLIDMFLPDGTLTFVNKAYCKYFNSSADKLVGSNILKSIHKADQEKIIRSLRTITTKNPIIRNVQRTLDFSNKTKWQEWTNTGIFDSKGKLVEIQAVGRDITEQKIYEEQWKKYSFIANTTNDFLRLIDRNYRYVAINRAYANALGYKQEEIVGKKISYFWKKKFTESIKKELDECFEGKEVKVEQWVNLKTLGPRCLEMTYYPYFDENNAVTHAVVVSRDITDEKVTERVISKSKLIAEKSEKVRDEFFTQVSHEIRNPMNVIVGMTDLLDSTNLNKKQREYLRAIKLSTDNLLSTINDIIDLSKISSGKIELVNTQFDIKEIFERIYDIYKFKAKEKDLDFHYELDPNIPELLTGDSIRLNQILQNLVSNAIKFTNFGFVKLSAKLLSKDKSNANLQIVVQDTGVGIPKDKLNEIFEDFVQLDGANENSGAGLGLSIVKKLVELQNGEVSVVSEIKKGSSFIVNIPFKIAERTHAENDQAPVKLSDFSVKHLKILLAEDNKMNQFLLAKLLDKIDARYKIVDNGVEALEELNRETFDLLLIDLKMPRLGGNEVIKVIRKGNKKYKNIPTIVVSAYTKDVSNNSDLQKLIDAYISKPFKSEELYSTIKAVLKKAKIKKTKSEPKKVIDWSYLREFAKGDKEFVDQVVGAFREEVRLTIDKLESILTTQNWDELYATIHRFKPTVTYMGIQFVEKEILQIEALCNDHEGKDLFPKGLANEIIIKLKQVQNELASTF